MVIATGALAAGAGLASAAEPEQVRGLHRVVGYSQNNSESAKMALAYCEPGERVIGGGGWVSDTGGLRPTLTELRPVRLFGGGTRDAYVVSGAETTPGTSGNWYLTAYAMCAQPLAGLNIQATTSQPSSPSPSVQATAAVCPIGQRVIGTGARASTVPGRGRCPAGLRGAPPAERPRPEVGRSHHSPRQVCGTPSPSRTRGSISAAVARATLGC